MRKIALTLAASIALPGAAQASKLQGTCLQWVKDVVMLADMEAKFAHSHAINVAEEKRLGGPTMEDPPELVAERMKTISVIAHNAETKCSAELGGGR